MILLPRPQKMVSGSGSFVFSAYQSIVMDVQGGRQMRKAAQLLCDEMNRFAGFTPNMIRGKALAGDVLLRLEPALKPQAYRLQIRADGVEIAGGSEAGVLYGAQTLRQIIRQCGPVWPCCSMEDEPVIEHRGFYHDVTRGRVPTLDSLKKIADTAAMFKLNQLQLYVEHTFLFREMSEMWRVGHPLTAAEIMELDEYCKDLGVELVPSLSCFGHLFELLHTKTFCDLCELTDSHETPSTMPNRMRHHTINADDPRALALITAMIDEFMPLFSSRRFNLCADETYDLGKGRGKKRMEEVGEKQYYIGFVKALCDHIISRGGQPMFWGDIVVRFPEALKQLPEEVICLNWGYNPAEKEDATRIFAQTGAKQYVCPGVWGWNEWLNRFDDSYQNISRMADYAKKYKAEGFLNTDWGDYGHINDQRFSMPGLIYGAVMSWQQENPPFDKLNEEISRLYYLDPSGSLMGELAKVQGNTLTAWAKMVQYHDFCLGILSKDRCWAPEKNITPEAVEAANRTLDEVLLALRRLLCRADAASRKEIHDMTLAVEAVQLCNLVGCRVLQQECKDAALAVRLEKWFHEYEKMWRSGCHEAELWRARDVVYWYADQLR